MKNWLGGEASEQQQKAGGQQPAPEPTLKGGADGFLGKGFKLEGILDVSGPVRIDGQVKGTVRSRDRVSLGETARVEGEIHCALLSVAGQVTGNVHCTERLEILRTGLVEGDVHVPALGIEPGGILEGRCHMRAESKAEPVGRSLAPAPAASVVPSRQVASALS